MARWAAYLDSTRKLPAHRMAVSGGNLFTPGSPEERAKGQAMFHAFHDMRFDAVSLAENDFSYGLGALEGYLSEVPLVSTNLEWGDSHEPLGQRMIVKSYRGMPGSGNRKGSFKVAVLSFLDERSQGIIDSYLSRSQRKVHIVPIVESAKEWVPKARAEAEIVVALVQLTSGEAARFAKDVPGIDVMVAGKNYENTMMRPQHEGGTVVVANTDRGRFVGELKFNFSQLADPVPGQIFLDQNSRSDTTYKWLVDWSKRLGSMEAIARVACNDTLNLGASWAGSGTCQNCHADIVDSWSKTRHASAMADLKLKHEETNLECLKCHAVGVGERGFDPRYPAPSYQNVQCESCHGSAVRHLYARPDQMKDAFEHRPDKKTCLKCHDSHQDPKFDYKTAWARIRHG